ncbi:MAG: GTPase HflX [Clostridia bacterium]|nr:GTPase HflX [Clostridia bacterium]
MEENKNIVKEYGETRRAVLCGVFPQGSEIAASSSLDELEALLSTAGGEASFRVTQSRDLPDKKTVFGKGKIEELKLLCENEKIDFVIFDAELSPSQIRDIEEALGGDVDVIDRSMLILDIFALHAKTAEGRLQVELAQLKYTAPRIRGKGKSMSRLGGSAAGSIGSRGPGETKLELDKRRIRERTANLEDKIAKLAERREVTRNARDRAGMKKVGIVGYTNAGKSTLLNCLTSAGILAEDKLFATLDTTTRKFSLPEGTDILLTDTVGFINKLPHHLVDAFRSTLDEAFYSDVLLIVSDVSDPECEMKLDITLETLRELGAGNKPKLFVFNKSDKADRDKIETLKRFGQGDEQCVFISALTGYGIEELVDKLGKLVNAGKRKITCRLSQSDGAIMNLIYREADSVSTDYRENEVICTAVVDEKLYGRLTPYIIEE